MDESGERIPFTIADYDREKGTVTIIFQEVGASTLALGLLNEGDSPGRFRWSVRVASELEGVKKAAVIGGGLGSAIAYPQAKKLNQMGASVDVIMGYRNKDIIILEKEMAEVSDRLFVTTDDGSNGTKGFVSDILQKLLDEGTEYDVVIAIGPAIMMKVVCDVTRPHGIRTIVSLNPIMIDGTGMCGGCRVTVGGETKFACVDGPDFDGHQVDFDELMRRLSMYKDKERTAVERHKCRLEDQVNAK